MNLIPGVDVEALITVADQIQQIRAADLTEFTASVTLESGGGLESDTVATALQLTLRATGANVALLSAGAVDVWVQTDRAPQTALGIG